MARRANRGGYFDRVAAPRRDQTLILAPNSPRFADPATPARPPVQPPPGLPEMFPTPPPRVAVRSAPPASAAAFSAPSSARPISRQLLTPAVVARAPVAADGAVAPPLKRNPRPPLAGPGEPASSLPPPPPPPLEPAFARLERLAMQPGQTASVSAAALGLNAPEADVSPAVTVLMPAPIAVPPPFKVKPARLAPVAQPEAIAVPAPLAALPVPLPEVHPGAPETAPRALPPAMPVAPPSIHIGLVEVRVVAPAPAPPVFAPRASPPAAPRGALARGYGWRYGVGQS